LATRYVICHTLNKGRRRYFEGQIWVDDRDFQIVKTFGKAVGILRRHEDQQFPKFETLRELCRGRYAGPSSKAAEASLLAVISCPNRVTWPSQASMEMRSIYHRT
jgi:hypothetical protein